jgi:hypothetical protein
MNKIPVAIGFSIWIETLLLPIISSKLIKIEIINLPISIVYFIFLKSANFILSYFIGFSNINVIISWICILFLLVFTITIINIIYEKIGSVRTAYICLIVGFMCSPISIANFLNGLSALNFISF